MYSNELICKILNYIDNNINKKISIEELSLRFYYNRFYIMKLFKKEIGISLFDYINNLRIYNSINSINNSDIFQFLELSLVFKTLKEISLNIYNGLGNSYSNKKKSFDSSLFKIKLLILC